MRGVGVATLALFAAATVAAPSSAVAPSLNQAHATLQFQGRMSTHWSLGPEMIDDGCEIDTQHGSGTQTIEYTTHHQHVNMTLVDAGANLTFQPDDRPTQHHAADGFRYAELHQIGTVEDDFTPSPSRDPQGCPPLRDPSEVTQNDSGCGGAMVPWEVNLTAAGGKFMVFVSDFPPEDLVSECPFKPVHGHEPAGVIGSFPAKTQESIPTSEVRRAMERRHGKLIVHGSQRWHSSGTFGGPDITATTTVSWKVTLIRAHP